MFIEPMIGLSGIAEKQKESSKVSGEKNSVFQDIFASAVNNVKTTEAELAQTQYLFSTGQLEEPHLLTIASTKAQTSVDFLVMLRNKALDAYNEMMRMNI